MITEGDSINLNEDILKELKDEDFRVEQENDRTLNYEQQSYEFKYKNCLLPNFGSRSKENGECFSVRFDDSSSSIAGGIYLLTFI